MDLNGDGASELFGLQSDQMEPLEWNTISIIQCRNGQAETLWRQDQAAFESHIQSGFSASLPNQFALGSATTTEGRV